MRALELLIEDYERRLKTVNEEKQLNIGKMKYGRLEAKASCYRYFLVELKRVLAEVASTDGKLNMPVVMASAFVVKVHADDLTQTIVAFAEDKAEAKKKVGEAYYRWTVKSAQKCKHLL